MMADVLVAAIARPFDDVYIEKILLQCVGMETRRLTLFTRDIFRTKRARARMQFIPFSNSTMASGMRYGAAHEMGRTLALAAYLVDANSDHLSNVGIPNDAAHRYNIAIDEGCGVVTYVTSTENAPLIAQQFRACGFVEIRGFH